MSKAINLNEKKGILRTFSELLTRCTTTKGAVDLSAIANMPTVGYNGGVKCDVTEGPCSCGAWHPESKAPPPWHPSMKK